jgi:glycogen debranching enzyme
MDAKGPQGPYSPRGSRATDIQALWIDALQAASSLVRFSTEPGSVALQSKVDSLHVAVKQAYVSRFFADLDTPQPRFYDALQAKGTSASVRPNVLFGIHHLPQARMRRAITERLTRELGTRWGLLSLSPQDPWFHPYHKAEPLYEQDASYHNGIVWLWNSGIWIEHLLRHGQLERASEITRNYAGLMASHLTLGTLPELIDALPRRGAFVDQYPDAQAFPTIARLDQLSLRNAAELAPEVPALSGTWSQAWSLSEFIRSITDDYTGLQYHVGQGFQLTPHFPQAWGNVLVVRSFAHYRMELRRVIGQNGTEWLIRFSGEKVALPMVLPFHVAGMPQPVALQLSGREDRYVIRQERGRWTLRRNDQKYDAVPASLPLWDPESQGGAAPWPLWDSEPFQVDQRRYKSQLNPS